MHCDAQQEKADREFDETDGEEVDRLGDKIQLVASREVGRFDVLDVSPSSIVDFWNDDDLACDTL